METKQFTIAELEKMLEDETALHKNLVDIAKQLRGMQPNFPEIDYMINGYLECWGEKPDGKYKGGACDHSAMFANQLEKQRHTITRCLLECSRKIHRSCGEGWYSLIDACEKELAAIGIENNHWVQIKEKLGGLRLCFDCSHLTSAGQKQAHKIALKFERQAWQTCEKCGSQDDVTTKNGGYIVTRCKSCHEGD